MIAGVAEEPIDVLNEASPAVRRPASARPHVALGLILLVAIGLPLLITAVTGSLAIPHGDDWSYLKSARILADEHEVRLLGWVSTGLIGQLVLSWPGAALFGSSITVFNLTTVAFGTLALLATHDVFRQLLAPRRALFGTAVVGLFPFFSLLTTSYMSDVYGLAMMMSCLAIGLRALRRDDLRLLALSLAVGLVGFTIREQVIAAPLALLIAAALGPAAAGERHRIGALPWLTDRRISIAGLGALLVAGCGLFVAYRQSVPNVDQTYIDLGFVPVEGMKTAARAAFTFGLVLLPVTYWRWLRPRSLRSIGLWVAVLLLGFVAEHVKRPTFFGGIFTGNYLTSTGPGRAFTSVVAPQLFPRVIYLAMEALALLSLALLVCATARWAARLAHQGRPGLVARLTAWRTAERLPATLGLFGLGYAIGVLLPGLFGWPFFDRYLLPLTVPAMAIVLRGTPLPGRWGAGFAGAGLAGAGLVMVVVTAWSASADAAAWRAGESLTRDFGDATRVDAGFEWTSYHAAGPALTWRLRLPRERQSWYGNMSPASWDCHVVSSGPLAQPRLELIGTRTFRSFVVAGNGKLFVYANRRCQPPAPAGPAR